PIRRPPNYLPFPYTTLFRSQQLLDAGKDEVRLRCCDCVVQVVQPTLEQPRKLLPPRLAADHRYEGAPADLRVGHPSVAELADVGDRKSTRLNSSHDQISYAV